MDQPTVAGNVAPVAISPIAQIIEDARNGRMFIIVDDEARGHEAYLMIAAQMVTPDAINFMATHARGLVSVALNKRRADDLLLPLLQDTDSRPRRGAGGMSGLERAHHATSIEAVTGVDTGISAADRARTISVAIDASTTTADITTPGHVFPLVARRGGVLERAGCTEAAVDIARLAGLNPSGVITAMLREDGDVASLADLRVFVKWTDIKIGTISDLIRYRMEHDRLVRRVHEQPLESAFGGAWLARIYRDILQDVEHLVLQKGDVDPNKPTLVCIHVSDFVTDSLGSTGSRENLLGEIMERIAQAGAGVLIILRDVRPEIMSQSLKSRDIDCGSRQWAHAIGAQILCDLDVHEIVLIGADRDIAGIGATELTALCD
jgi:3,4-dihydroxy 2-butanone 4-phosphate synthase/GTP cyclohydrolase II